jgi:hypothetical protein
MIQHLTPARVHRRAAGGLRELRRALLLRGEDRPGNVVARRREASVAPTSPVTGIGIEIRSELDFA